MRLRPRRLPDRRRPRRLPRLPLAPGRWRRCWRRPVARVRANCSGRRVPDRDRRRRRCRASGGRRGVAADAAPDVQHPRPFADHRRRPDRLFERAAGAVCRVFASARALPADARPHRVDADRVAVALGCPGVPRNSQRTRSRRRSHQRSLCRIRLDAGALPEQELQSSDPVRVLPRRRDRARDAVPRRHEPGRQGVCRGAAAGRSRHPGSVVLRRRGARTRRGDYRQSIRSRSHGRGNLAGPADAARGAARAVDGDDGDAAAK